MGAAGAQGERWFLADLDRDTIQRLQRARGEGAAPNAAQTAAAGWGTGDFKALPEVARNLIRTWLRAPLWLVPTVPRPAPRAAAPRGPTAATAGRRQVPCPEGALLTLDWALSRRGALSEARPRPAARRRPRARSSVVARARPL
jgi:hypothetical protein